MSDIKRYAIIEGGVVTNVVLWDGILPDPDTPKGQPVEGWTPPEGAEAIECPDDAGIGWTYENGEWSAPVPAEGEE